MKDEIIMKSIELLRRDGLKFSIDKLANTLKISKKTIYKYFPDKEALALALYDKYYTDVKIQSENIISNNTVSIHSDLLHLYFDSKVMIRSDIFNKYKLNETIYSYTIEQNNALWKIISKTFNDQSDENSKVLQIIVDGAFEKICKYNINPDNIISKLVNLI